MPGAPDDQHPDLDALAGELRAEWRAEQEAATADAAAHWRLSRTLADWLRDRMHAGDHIAVTIASCVFGGVVDEVGDDLVALRTTAGRVEIHVGDAIPVVFEVVQHAIAGGTRSATRRTFHDALLARDGRVVRIGTARHPEGLEGTVLVSRDFVTIRTEHRGESVVPLVHVAWVAALSPR